MDSAYSIALVAMFLVLAVRGETCRNDKNARPKLTFNEDDLDETFYQLPQIIDSSDLYPRPAGERRKAKLTYLAGGRRCPYRGSGSVRRSLTGTQSAYTDLDPILPRYFEWSTCPSYLIINHDENRVPSTIVEAVCSCKRCGRSRLKESRCKPIFYFRQVLRRECNGATYEYSKTMEPIQVGCTCVEGRQ